jgi:hypothetical protein
MSGEADPHRRRSALGLVADKLRSVRIRWLVITLSVALVGSTVPLALGVNWWMPGMLLVAIAGAALWALVDRALLELRARPNPKETLEIIYVGMRWIAAGIGIFAIAEFLISAAHIVIGGGWN